MTPRETIHKLAAHIKTAVYPHLGTWRARRVTGIASSGDATFDIDEIAENAIEQYIQERGLNIAYYSEDRGLITPYSDRVPEGVLIIDPIDGTRAAVAGFEACVVSVAWCDYSPKPTLGDVRYAAILEIKGGTIFTAERGEGIRISDASDAPISPFLAPTATLDSMAWALEVVGAPMDLLMRSITNLASRTTVRGGFFVLNSSAFELTRLVTGQLSGVIDVRTRLLREFPQAREQFRTYGGGRLLSLYGYDIAAAALIAQEAGCIVTDAWGRDLSGWDLMDTTEQNFGSLLAASNPTLHAQILEAVDAGFVRLHAEIDT